jgi:hypothetical protein
MRAYARETHTCSTCARCRRPRGELEAVGDVCLACYLWLQPTPAAEVAA